MNHIAHPLATRAALATVAALATFAASPAACAAEAEAAAAASYTAYVGNDQCPTNNSVSKITGPAWALGATIGVGSCPAGIAFSPDGSKAYMLNAGDNTITPIDTTTFTAGAAFPSGVIAPIFVAVTPDGKSIVTAGAGSNNLAIISTVNTGSIQLVPVGAGPLGLAVLPDSSAVVVANNGDGTLSVVRLGRTPALIKTITFPSPGCQAYDVAVTPDGASVYTSCSNGPLWKVSAKTGKPAAAPIAIPQASGGLDIVITPDGRKAYVANFNGAVYPVVLKTGTVGAAIPIVGAYGLAISPDGKALMVGNGYCCFIDTPVSIVSTATDTVTSVIPTGGNYTHRWLAFKP